MLKLKMGILLSFILLLTGCYNGNQKVTKLTAADDLITAFKQNEYLTNYNSIDAIEINERIEIGKQIEIFILHAFLVKDAEVKVEVTEEIGVKKQDQLMLLYAIHNQNDKIAIDTWTDFRLSPFSNSNISEQSFKIDMCKIKPGWFCKLRQPSYTIQIANLEVAPEDLDRMYKEDTELEVTFEFVTAENSAELFFSGLKAGYPPNDIRHVTKTLSLNFKDVDDKSKSFN